LLPGGSDFYASVIRRDDTKSPSLQRHEMGTCAQKALSSLALTVIFNVQNVRQTNRLSFNLQIASKYIFISKEKESVQSAILY
jgi:hypothetical protein